MLTALTIAIATLAAISTANASPLPLTIARSTDVQCAQASRFGNVFDLPQNITTGQSYTITHDYTCAFYFGLPPTYTDYLLEVGSNGNGHQAPILVARRSPTASGITAENPKDTFTFEVPFAYYWAPASYNLVTTITAPTKGTKGTPVLQQGGVYYPVQIVDTGATPVATTA